MSTLITHMKEPKVCIACGAKFQPVTKWMEFCCSEHRYAWSESIKMLGLTYAKEPKGDAIFREYLKAKLIEVDEKAGRRQAQQAKAIDEKVAEIKSTTWGEWIKSNFKTHEEQDAFVKENEGSTFMSVEQRLGETYEQFLARAAEEEK